MRNPRGRWKPGLFVNGTILTDEFTAVAIPKTAVELIDNKPCVFVRSTEGFEPRFVSLGREDQAMVEVLDGLKLGEQYVTKGGFTLKAELQKEQFEDGNGH